MQLGYSAVRGGVPIPYTTMVLIPIAPLIMITFSPLVMLLELRLVQRASPQVLSATPTTRTQRMIMVPRTIMIIASVVGLSLEWRHSSTHAVRLPTMVTLPTLPSMITFLMKIMYLLAVRLFSMGHGHWLHQPRL